MEVTRELFELAHSIHKQVNKDSFEPVTIERVLNIVAKGNKSEFKATAISRCDGTIVELILEPLHYSELFFHGFISENRLVCSKALKQAKDLRDTMERLKQINY